MAQKRTEIADAQQLRAAVKLVLRLCIKPCHTQTFVARRCALDSVEHACDCLFFRLRLPDCSAAVRFVSCKATVLKRTAVCLVKLDLCPYLRQLNGQQLCQIQFIAQASEHTDVSARGKRRCAQRLCVRTCRYMRTEAGGRI